MLYRSKGAMEKVLEEARGLVAGKCVNIFMVGLGAVDILVGAMEIKYGLSPYYGIALITIGVLIITWNLTSLLVGINMGRK